MFEPSQRVKVNLSGLTIKGVAPVLEVGSIAAIVAGAFILGRSPLVHCTQGSGAAESESGEYEGASRA